MARVPRFIASPVSLPVSRVLQRRAIRPVYHSLRRLTYFSREQGTAICLRIARPSGISPCLTYLSREQGTATGARFVMTSETEQSHYSLP